MLTVSTILLAMLLIISNTLFANWVKSELMENKMGKPLKLLIIPPFGIVAAIITFVVGVFVWIISDIKDFLK
jgi:hypothetical protein